MYNFVHKSQAGNCSAFFNGLLSDGTVIAKRSIYYVQQEVIKNPLNECLENSDRLGFDDFIIYQVPTARFVKPLNCVSCSAKFGILHNFMTSHSKIIKSHVFKHSKQLAQQKIALQRRGWNIVVF